MDEPRDRVRGSVLGLAYGEAFGCPVEGWRATDITTFFGEYRALPEAWPPQARGLPVEHRKRMRPMGLHSDDTQQALALLNICLSEEGWSERRWADWLIKGFEQRAWRGFSHNFVGAVHRLRRGDSPRAAGTQWPGIGPATRVGPLGALYADRPEAVCEVAYAASLVTHSDIRAAAVAHAVAYTTAALVRGQPVAEIREGLPVAVRAAEARWIERAEWDFDRTGAFQITEILAALFATPLGSPALVRASVTALAHGHLPPKWREPHANQGLALLGAVHGLAMALRDDAAPAETLVEVVAQGFDTDTVGALCGSLLGARFGTDWITIERLLDGGRITAYADALATREAAPEDQAAFMNIEAEWTRREGVFSEEMVAERRTGRPRPQVPLE